MAAANYTNGSSTGRMFEKWASTHARKYDGIDVPGPGGQVSLRGAKLTSAQLPTPFCSVHPNRSGYIKHNCSASDIKQQVSYWRQMYAAWERRGWADLLFDYTIDEPGCFSVSGQPVAWETLKETVGWVKEASPSLRSLVTVDMGHARKAGVIDEIDVFVPLINDLWPKEFLNGTRVCHPQGVGMNDVGANLTVSKNLRALYDGVNKTLWTYQSCMSYGCGPTSTCSQLMKHSNGPCSVHWPSYAIDHANEASAGVANRVMEWASYIERVQGELYYSTTVNFKSPNASWDEAKFYGANGDGYMYYPGRAAANVSFSIGGKTDIPIESVRLKHVRDGFEDNEWLRLLEKHKGRTHVLKLIQPFISNAWTFADNAAALLSARAAVGAAIQEAELKARSPVALSQDNLSDDIL